MRSNVASFHSLIRTAAAALIIIAVCAGGHLSAQQIPALSQRTGTIVSAAARNYFGLFPRVDGYRTTTFRDAGDSVVAEIRRDAGDTSISLSRAAFGRLRRYVDSFEAYHYGLPAGWDWGELRGIVHSINVFPESSTPFVVEMEKGGSVYGMLLYADDSVVVLGPEGYNPRRGDVVTGVQAIRVRDIVRMRSRTSGFGSMLSSFDVEFGHNDTIFRRYALGPLRDVAVFNPLPPPEVVRAMAASVPIAEAPPVTVALAAFEEQHRRSRFHVSLLYQYGDGLDRTLGTETFYGIYPDIGDYVGLGTTFPCIGLQYDIGSLRLGVWGSWTAPYSLSDDDRYTYSYRTLHGPGVLATARWVAQRASSIHNFSPDLCDVAIGGGLAVRALQSDRMNYTSSWSGEPYTNVETTTLTLIGMNLSLGLNYYLTDRFSIDSETRYTFWGDPLLSRGGYSDYEVRLSPWELLIGIGWHP